MRAGDRPARAISLRAALRATLRFARRAGGRHGFG